jgi:hypothetical protein
MIFRISHSFRGAFVMVDSGSSDGDSGIPLVGVAMVLFKVGVSCYAAVLSDAKLKGFSSMSMSAKLSLMSLSRVIASVAIAAVMEPDVQRFGMFRHVRKSDAHGMTWPF